MNRDTAERLITQYGREPYIKGHWMGARNAGYIMGFKGSTWTYRCSHDVGKQLLDTHKVIMAESKWPRKEV